MNNTKTFSTFWMIVIVIALALGALGTVLAATAIPVQAPIARSGNVTFRVTNGQAFFSNGGNTYTVTNGTVSLPASATWWADLVSAGVLQYTTATGSAMFYGPNLETVGTGAVVDLQSGSSVTLAATFNGNPTFAGSLTVSGNVTHSGTSLLTGAVTGSGAATFTGAGTFGSLVTAGGVQAAQITATGQLTGPVLKLGGATTLSGLTFGSAAAVVSGTLFAHGMGVTPTICSLTQSGVAITNVIMVAAMNVTSVTIGTTPGVASTVYWECLR